MRDLVELFATKQKTHPRLTLQVGEILTRVCEKMGDMAPHYSSLIIPVLLSTARNCEKTKIDPLLIASSLSAAAELLPLLGFYLHDIQVYAGALTLYRIGYNIGPI